LSNKVTPPVVRILGIGDDGFEGLTSTARACLDQADLIVATDDSLIEAMKGRCEQLVAIDDPEELAACVAGSSAENIVILTSGDPLFYGTARYLCDRLGKERFEVIPHVSSMQLAFARVKESWDDAYLTNLANQSLPRVIERIRTAEKVGLFTTDSAPPATVAQMLLDRGIEYFSAYVCENLGAPDECVTHAELAELAGHEFSPLNVMILVRKPDAPDRPSQMLGRRLFGNPDDMFLQSRPKRGLLTPAEVRCIALAAMDLGPASVVWDVGAGSGSVSIEAAQIAHHGEVYAIEMASEDHQLILANAERFGVTNLTPILGQAPEAWEDLPDADAIFIGGTGRQVSKMVELACQRLRPGGRLVVNVVSLDNLAHVQAALSHLAGESNVTMINVARGTQQLESVRFEAANPTFLLSFVKQG
jgi:precorrin-6Y C5,15-methyltransferase (decarboxylating)